MIAITGSTGFIGSYISNRLPLPQKRLIRKSFNTKSSFQTILGDLKDPLSIASFVENSEILLHMAWVNNPWTSNQNISEDICLNLNSSVELFEAFAKKNPGGHIIFASTGGNMYQGFKGKPFSETDHPQPMTSYSINKLSVENYLHLFCKKYGIKGSILRISNPYGLILPTSRTNGLIGVIFSKILNNETLNIIDSTESVRDYLHLDDLVDAVNIIIKNPPEPGHTQTYNISYGKGCSLQEVMDTIELVTNKKIIKKIINTNCQPSYSILSHDHIKNKLSWSPKVNLLEGIEKMWQTNNQSLKL